MGNKLRTIAFPSVSTGVYGFPVDRAAGIAVKELKKFSEQDDWLDRIITQV